MSPRRTKTAELRVGSLLGVVRISRSASLQLEKLVEVDRRCRALVEMRRNVTSLKLAIEDTRQCRESIQHSLHEMRAMCLRRY
jgi:hypothetical protein